MRCTLTLAHPTGVQVAMLVEDLAQVDAAIDLLLRKGYRPLSGPAGAPSAPGPPPVAAEPEAAPARPRGCEHLPLLPNDLHAQWLARFPDEAVRDAWWQVGKKRLSRKKGAPLIADTIPCIIAEALEAHDEYVALLKAQGVHVNGKPLFPPQRE